MLRRCWHPNCHKPMAWGMYVCKRHYALLNDELRRLIRSSTDAERVEGKPLHIKVVEFFDSLPKGEHRVVRCKYGCGTDVIWMDRAGGGVVLVEAESVEAKDRWFNAGKHTRHRCQKVARPPLEVRGAA